MPAVFNSGILKFFKIILIMKKEKILQWLDELANKNPENYQEYFF